MRGGNKIAHGFRLLPFFPQQHPRFQLGVHVADVGGGFVIRQRILRVGLSVEPLLVDLRQAHHGVHAALFRRLRKPRLGRFDVPVTPFALHRHHAEVHHRAGIVLGGRIDEKVVSLLILFGFVGADPLFKRRRHLLLLCLEIVFEPFIGVFPRFLEGVADPLDLREIDEDRDAAVAVLVGEPEIIQFVVLHIFHTPKYAKPIPEA